MFKSEDKVQYKNYTAVIVFKYDDGYTIRFRRGSIIVHRFCFTHELKAMNEQISLFDMIK